MRHTAELKHVTFALIGSLLIAGGFIAIPRWPTTLSYLLDGMFFVSIASIFMAVTLIWLMYLKKIAATDHRKALFSVLLIVLSVTTYGGLEVVAENTEFWRESLSNRHGTAIVLLSVFVLYGKNLVALGIAATGASLLASTIR